MENKNEMKLNLGCGNMRIPGFINIDIRKLEGVDYVTSIDKLDVFKDRSIDLIYASHVLEHVPRSQTEPALHEWYRVLKKGGVLRIAVPDFEAIIKVYLKNENLDELMGTLYGRQDYEYNFHYRIFDFKTSEGILKKIGFKQVKRYDFKETIHDDYPDYSWSYLPHGDRENGILISLNIEAIK